MDTVPLKSVLQFISQLKAFNYIPEFMNYVSIESWNDTDKWIMVPSENTSCDRGGPLQLKIAQYSREVFWTYLLTQYPFSLKISWWFLAWCKIHIFVLLMENFDAHNWSLCIIIIPILFPRFCGSSHENSHWYKIISNWFFDPLHWRNFKHNFFH